jgi:DNA-binding transcriptional ArsR family regulator
MWDEVLASEWDRNLPMLTESIVAFESLDFAGLTVLEALTRVSLRDVPPPVSESHFAAIERLILFPSAHTGPYLLRLGSLSGATERFAFGARIPEGAPTNIPTLSRSELLTRLNALADDTRLRILELLAQEGELNTPDIIARLELSQSAASRHLEHLAATGYLTVRRHEGAKCYQLNPERIDHTFKALKEFCG